MSTILGALRAGRARASGRRGAVLLAGLLALLVRAALLPLRPVPQPGIMDEYSYLLAADTFARGRLTNPTHPLWVSLESFHVLSQPTYASKYPPAQGLALAFGLVSTGIAWVGVWLSVGVMCGAIVWALAGWLPPRWAFFGGLLSLVRIAVGSYWIDSYWGGAMAAIGGALLYGALPRLLRHARPRDGLLLGVGLSILANSRPYEGLLAAVPAAIALARWAVRGRWPALRALCPALAVLGITAAAMAAYNLRVTGSPWRMPYMVYDARYGTAPLFWFQPPRSIPDYNHPTMRQFWTGWALGVYRHNLEAGVLSSAAEKLEILRRFFLGAPLTVPLVALPCALCHKRVRLAFVCLGVIVAGMLAEISVVPHYAAPATALIYLAVVECVRCLCAWRPRLLGGRVIPAALICALVASHSIQAAEGRVSSDVFSWCATKPGNLDRARLLDDLGRTEGQHLILVHYGPHHDVHREWIYNRADIDSAKVVWAWDMGPDDNRPLLDYFRSRRVWRLEADEPTPELRPYRDPQASPRSPPSG